MIDPQAQANLNEEAALNEARRVAVNHEITQVGVVGAGIMGAGIAWQSANQGFQVVVCDIHQASLDAARREIDRLGRRAVKNGHLSDSEYTQMASRVAFASQLAALSDCCVIVEAVTERADVKAQVLSSLSELAPGAVLTSNTSTIRIDHLAQHVSSSNTFAGLHFFNPVPVMPLVEVIVGQSTSTETCGRLVDFALGLGKKPVVVKDCPGFLVNRVLFPYLAEFERLLREGQSLEHIDVVMTEFGWPMGPGILCDVIGLDTCMHAGDVLADAFERMTPPTPSPLRECVAKGDLGQKTGSGFYRYRRSEYGRLEPSGTDFSGSAPNLSQDELIARLMAPMVDELARCLEESVVASAQVADAACVLGLGFPQQKGGPLFWAHSSGLWDRLSTRKDPFA